jgi:site-specific DNA-methyltransferase (adenine-specific)
MKRKTTDMPLAPAGAQRPPLAAAEKPAPPRPPAWPSARPSARPSGRGEFRLHQGDAVEWLRTLAPASVDLVITDPPYESLEKHRAIGTTTRLKHSKASSNDWFTIFPNARFEELFRELWRVLARNAHFYLFCDAETMFVARPIAEAAGFKFWKPLVWDKMKLGMGYHYRSRYEFILFFEKGKRKLASLAIPDVLEVPRIVNGYPTEKPVDVSRVLVEQSSAPGELVIDPFMGAASAGVAAVALGRTFLGNDLAPRSLELARERLLAAGGRERRAPDAGDAIATARSPGPPGPARKKTPRPAIKRAATARRRRNEPR